MTDLSRVLPRFPVGQYGALLPALEKHDVTTTELLTLDAAELGKRTQLPLLDLKRLSNAVLRALHADLGVAVPEADAKDESPAATANATTTTINHLDSRLRQTHAQLVASWSTISTLDPELDAALGGGVPTGCVTEVTGESGAGKTQFLMSLLLAVQLPPPLGLGKKAMYIPTEAALPTRRVAQMLAVNPQLRSASAPPSLDSILSLPTLGDLESQDHILSFQVPIEAARRDVGLVIIDSVAANFRAEFDRGGSGSSMAARSADLVRLGMQLRDLARTRNIAVVVANQVADRFEPRTPARPHPPLNTSAATPAGSIRLTQESPLASRTARPPPEAPSSSLSLPDLLWPRPSDPAQQQQQQQQQQSGHHHDIAALQLDHQQRWFTGWGDEEDDGSPTAGAHKTPSLGLVWSTQISARIALLKRPTYGHSRYAPADAEDRESKGDALGPTVRSWRRWMKVVFAPHAAPSGPGLRGATEFEIYSGGLRAVPAKKGLDAAAAATKRKRED